MTLHSGTDWKRQLADVVRDGDTLLCALGLTPEQVGFSAAACRGFRLKVPWDFVRRMRHGDPDDPLLRQVLATGDELLDAPGFGDDPTGEAEGAVARAGILHKYRGRVLLVVAGGCAVNCRYCFRRHFPYDSNRVGRKDWAQALDYVAAAPDIHEVILSGGDPLVADDPALEDLCATIADIHHVRRIRVHTRLPIVLPARVTDRLLAALSPAGVQTVFVVHANHAREIDDGVGQAFQRILDAGMTLLNQSVLLAGVNDDIDTLAELSETLFAHGALPYYLHVLDRVTGAAHFDLPESRALALHAGLRKALPGYLVPRLVREVAGEASKTPLA
nr:EF-P beta-lysylation protein EpmB [Marinihelvus fidelis]